ncbi:MAG: hypothetical protein AAF518_21595 [Spirochaetota bacterium]
MQNKFKIISILVLTFFFCQCGPKPETAEPETKPESKPEASATVEVPQNLHGNWVKADKEESTDGIWISKEAVSTTNTTGDFDFRDSILNDTNKKKLIEEGKYATGIECKAAKIEKTGEDLKVTCADADVKPVTIGKQADGQLKVQWGGASGLYKQDEGSDEAP